MRDQLITAAFFMEGLHDVKPGGYDALITSWGRGCIELVDALVTYVPLTTKLCKYGAKATHGIYPGVFDYEVSAPFGKWFGEYILEHGHEPSKKEVQIWLTKEVDSFFKLGPI